MYGFFLQENTHTPQHTCSPLLPHDVLANLQEAKALTLGLSLALLVASLASVPPAPPAAASRAPAASVAEAEPPDAARST